MKNIIAMLLLVLLGAFVMPTETKAQLVTLSVSAADDTLTNTQTGNLTLTANSPRDVITFELKVVRVSGTAAGTAKLQGSLDGTTWYDIGSAFTITNTATQSNVWTVTPSNFIYYRVNVAASGTMVIAPTGKALIRKL